jgi:sirohydrochlorin cobaltochelatase
MVIFIAHGSRNAAWRASIEASIEVLRADVGNDRVSLAYMECAPPTLMDAAARAVEAGAKRIRFIPLFLAVEGHVDRNIRPLVEEVRAAFDNVEVYLAPPIGQHPSFLDVLRTIISEQED